MHLYSAYLTCNRRDRGWDRQVELISYRPPALAISQCFFISMRKQLVASIMSTAAVLLLPRSRLKLLWPSFSFGCRVSPSELKGRRAPPCELYGSELLRLSCSPALHELLRLPCSFARPPKQQTPPPPCSSSSAWVLQLLCTSAKLHDSELL
jgi:hypothetical protein